jgi:hypothetical protein
MPKPPKFIPICHPHHLNPANLIPSNAQTAPPHAKTHKKMPVTILILERSELHRLP